MAEGVYCYRYEEQRPIAALMLAFYEKTGTIEQPILIADQIDYKNSDTLENPKNACDPWDLWVVALD